MTQNTTAPHSYSIESHRTMIHVVADMAGDVLKPVEVEYRSMESTDDSNRRAITATGSRV